MCAVNDLFLKCFKQVDHFDCRGIICIQSELIFYNNNEIFSKIHPKSNSMIMKLSNAPSVLSNQG